MFNEYIYLKVPEKWKAVYDSLLIKMAELGTDLLIECNASCKGVDKEYIACWNMFQAACTAYELKEFSKANTLIKFICTKLKINLEDYSVKHVYHCISHTLDIDSFVKDVLNPNGPYNFETHSLLTVIDKTIEINQTDHYQLILIPDDDNISIAEAKYGIPGLWSTIEYNKITNIVIDDISYTLYYYYSPVGKFDEKVYVTFDF